jgi:CDGSH-type Zn-finger protein
MKYKTNYYLSSQAARTCSYISLLPSHPTHFKILSANFHFKTVRNFCHSNLECIIRSLQQYSACGCQLSKTLQYCSTKALPPDGSHIRYTDEAETRSSFRNLITRRCFVTTLLAVLELLNALACVYTIRMTSTDIKLMNKMANNSNMYIVLGGQSPSS